MSFLVKNLVIKSRSNHELSTVKWDNYHTISTRLRRKKERSEKREKMPRLWYEAKKMKTARDVKSKTNPMI